MEIILEIVLEILFEFFMEGVIGAAQNIKVPITLRLILMTLICVPFAVFLIIIGLSALKRYSNMFPSILLWIVAAVMFVFWILTCRKIIKHKSKQ